MKNTIHYIGGHLYTDTKWYWRYLKTTIRWASIIFRIMIATVTLSILGKTEMSRFTSIVISIVSLCYMFYPILMELLSILRFKWK
jgi:hypothetical protein